MKYWDSIDSAVSVGVFCTLCPHVRHLGRGRFLSIRIIAKQGSIEVEVP